jgi:hypothetical protein
MDDWDHGRTWYHGSPERLASIRPGSSITQNRALAEAFSHRPGLVSVSDDELIRHNGLLPGLLYAIAEEVGPADVCPHPHTTMVDLWEWVTERDLRVCLTEPTTVRAEDLLTEAEVTELRRRAACC